MKPLKYTMAALALIAAASFTSSAKAQTLTTGDVMLGIYDTSATAPNSYELNLGAFNALLDGETWNLGTSISSGLSGANASDLEFALSATGGTGTNGALGLSKQEIGLSNVIPSLNGGALNSLPGTNTTENTDITAQFTPFNSAAGVSTLITGTSSTGTGFLATAVADTTTGSFANEDAGNTYGLGVDIASAYTDTASTEFDVFKTGTGTATEVGTFTFSDVSGNEILTFDTLAVPEPSAYALGLCAIALFWVLKRRNSVV